MASGLLLVASPVQAADATTVTRADIASDESTYAGWHLGAGKADQVDVTRAGLTMIGRTQVIKGYADNGPEGLDEHGVNADLSDDLVGAAFDVTGGDVHFQVPIFVDADDDATTAATFATLRNAEPATGDTTVGASDVWTLSRAVGSIPANTGMSLSDIIAGVEAHAYKTIGFGVYTDTAKISSVASIGFKGSVYSFADAAATTSTTVTNGDVRDEETSSNYGSWHQGYAGATVRHQVTAAGLELAGKSQIIKGYANNTSTLNAQNANLAFALLDASYTVAPGSDEAFFQVPLFFNDGSGVKFTTLRSAGHGAGTHTFGLNDQWQSSKALDGIPANSNAPLGKIIAALGTYKTIGYGVLTTPGQSATVSNVTFDGRSFDFADAPDLGTTTKNVKEKGIAPDETVYAGWHQGAPTNSARIVDGKLHLGAEKSQIINGYADNDNSLNDRNANLRQVLRSASYDVASGTVHFQIPMFFEDPTSHTTTFTTLRTTAPADAGTNTFSLGQQWTSSKKIDGVVDANGSALLGDILSALPNYKVLAFGVFSDAGADGVVNSISWDGVKHTFVDADPTAADISKTTRTNTPVDITLDGKDAEDAVTYTVGTADHGTVVSDGAQVTYTPDEDFTGADEFAYTVSDGGFNTVEGTVTVDVIANRAPVVASGQATDVRAGGDEIASLNLDAQDPDGDDIARYDVAENADGFAFLIPGTNRLRFVPNEDVAQDADEVVVLKVTATDEFGKVSEPQDVTITVKANRAPTAGNVSATTAAGKAVTVTLDTSDPEGDAVTFSSGSEDGEVVIDGKQLTFTPKAGYVGTSAFPYTATDSRGASATGEVRIVVKAAAQAAAKSTIKPGTKKTKAGNTYVTATIVSAGTVKGGTVDLMKGDVKLGSLKVGSLKGKASNYVHFSRGKLKKGKKYSYTLVFKGTGTAKAVSKAYSFKAK